LHIMSVGEQLQLPPRGLGFGFGFGLNLVLAPPEVARGPRRAVATAGSTLAGSTLVGWAGAFRIDVTGGRSLTTWMGRRTPIADSSV
jgi:hypothetical protein